MLRSHALGAAATSFLKAEIEMINELSPEAIADLGAKFKNASPFPHVVIDNFLKPGVFDALNREMREYYSENKTKGATWRSDAEDGKWGSTGLSVPPRLAELDAFLGSDVLKKLLSGISGFGNLEVTSNINGVGFSFFHAMEAGSYLGPHTDHTRDLNNGPYHVLNIILYMADAWDPNWGGGTTLFSENIRLDGVVEYRPNRALIFMHGPKTIHGTQRISSLASKNRLSIYYDYYTWDKNPYTHLGDPGVPLLNSPHLFYLPNWLSYLKKPNRRYAKMHLAHLKEKLVHHIFGTR